MTDRQVYEEIRRLVEEHDGTMKFEREGHQWGAWIISVGNNRRVFLSNGSGFPELDRLYEPNPDVPQPSHSSDYSGPLVKNAWDKLVQLLAQN